MKTQLNYAKIFMETVILTVAVAIIAAAVYFFPGTKPYLCQQYLRSWNRTVQLHPTSAVCDHDDSECHTSDYRLSYLRSGIWCKNRIYQHHAPGLSWNI